jgi:hypothetical protein
MRLNIRRTALLLPLVVLAAACSDLNGPGGPIPRVRLTAPAEGAVLDAGADSLMVTGVATDDRMVVRITTEVTQGESGTEVEVPIAMSRAVAFSSVVHDIPIGNFTLTVQAYDADGRTGEQTVTLSRPGFSLLQAKGGE